MSSLKTGRKAVAAASDPARRLGLGGHLAGSQEPGRPTQHDELEEGTQESSRWWQVWKRGSATTAASKVVAADNTTATWWVTRGFTWAIVGCVLAGPLALAVAVNQDAPIVVNKTEGPALDGTATVGEASAAGEMAVTTVRRWLASTAQDPQLPEQGGAWPKVATKATNLRVAKVEQAGGGAWQVTVAAQLPSGERYFAVPVVVADGVASALAMPRATAAPSVGEGPGRAYEQPGIALTSPMSRAVEEFLGAYLGGSDTTRFTSPGAVVPAVEGNAWTQVKVDSVDAHVPSGADATSSSPAEGEQAQVFVGFTMQRGQERATAIPSSMALSLTARGGRWEVAAVDPAPRVKGSSSPSDSSSSTDDEVSNTSSNEGN